ncbi:lipoprotein [Streptomyces sp. MMG1533]|uniref:META domain-containing protein n=1 Tax=Streptomyces sp. MMG1533 TaxID=1415546 RepID=UPI0006B00C3A|nr:META domain-containing protein [Streptomyces sp. MMG1533]KOU55709.1 lipoprotein [Streptomyces sp. MMG1533]
MYRQKDTQKDRHKPRLTLTATAAVALVPLAAACGSEKADGGSVGAAPPVTGIHWSIDSVTVDGTTHTAPADAHVEIADGKAAGNYGCNHFNAKAAVEGESIRLSDATATEMACEKQPMAFERTLARTLADGTLKTELEDGRLTLTTEAGDRVNLTKAKDASLYGTKWQVTSPASRSKAHLTFDKKAGKVSGSLGCNKVNANATVSDGHITLGAPSTTRMMCDASLMNVEKDLLRLFDSTVSYELDHRTLTLTSENDDIVTAVADK